MYFYLSRHGNLDYGILTHNIVIYVGVNIIFMLWMFFAHLRIYKLWKCILGAVMAAVFGAIFFVIYLQGDMQSNRTYVIIVVSIITLYLIEWVVFRD